MANIREIQTRINSVKDTMKITNAMYMISSTKMRQAKKKLTDSEPYFYGLQGEISRILRHIPEIEHRYFDVREEIPKEKRKIGSIVITADKGLAGAYNHNIVKVEDEILEEPGDISCSRSVSLADTIMRIRVWKLTPISFILCRNRPCTGQEISRK